MAWEISRRKREEKYHYGYSRPPRDEKPYMPPLEKKFCAWIRGIPWHRIVDRQMMIHWHGDIIEWNDSAAEEAFRNARNRFWAELKGLPCTDKLPDPDLYIDEIDWVAKTDSELLSDLEREDHISDKFSEGGVVNLLSALGLNESFSSIGWGDNEEQQQFKGAVEPVKDKALVLTEFIPWTGWDDNRAVELQGDCDQNLNKYEKDCHNLDQGYRVIKDERWSRQNRKHWVPKGSKESGWDIHGGCGQQGWDYHEVLKKDTKYRNDWNYDEVKENCWESSKDWDYGYRADNRSDKVRDRQPPPHPHRGFRANKGRKGSNLPPPPFLRLPSYWRW